MVILNPIRMLSFLSLSLYLMPVSIFGVGTVYISGAICVPLAAMLLNRNTAFKFDELLLMTLMILMMIYLVIFAPFVRIYPAGMNKMIFMGMYLLILSYSIVFIYKTSYRDRFPTVLFDHVLYLSSFNALISILVLVSDDAKHIIYSFVDTSEINLTHLSIGMRSSGLFYFGGSILSVFNAACEYLALIRLSETKNNKYLFMAGILFIGIVTSGRLGMIFIVISLFMAFIFPVKYFYIEKKWILRIITLVCLLIFSIVLIFNDKLERFITWASEIVIGIFSSDVGNSTSQNVLESMYRFPKDLLYGDGIFDQLALNIDVGWLLIIHYIGLFGLMGYLFLYMIFIYLVLAKKNHWLRTCSLLLITYILMGNFKDIYLYSSNGVTQLLFLSIFSCFSFYRIDKNN